MANPIARVHKVVVRFILDPPLAASREIAPKVRARDVQQRPNDATAPRMNARQSGQPCAPNQLQEERFRLIVLRVAYRDAVGTQVIGSLAHEVISDSTGCIFD